MSTLLSKSWTQYEFLTWASGQEGRYEFDGVQPVAMTGGTVNHALITQNIQAALRERLRGGGCRPLGPDAGVATVGTALRYPDALVTCSPLDGEALTVPGVVAVFEVLSTNTSRTDRIIKVREYAAVASIRYYLIVESTSIGLTVHERKAPAEPWRVTTLLGEDLLRLPELGIELPVVELYADVAFRDEVVPER